MHGTYIRLHKEKQAHQAEIQGLKVRLCCSAQPPLAQWVARSCVVRQRHHTRGKRIILACCCAQEAVDQAGTAEEAAKWAGQIEVLQRRREVRVQRWQAAFDVLHVELKALKAAITAFKTTAGVS